MLLTRFRSRYDAFSARVGKALGRMPLTPNGWTLVSLLLGGLSGYLAAVERFHLCLVAAAFAGVADMVDGAVARAGNTANAFGAVLDRVVDRYVEFLVVLGVVLSGHIHPGWGVFGLLGGMLASYTRASAESIGKVPDCAVGLMERQEKAVFIFVGLLLEPWFPGDGHPFHGALTWVFIVGGSLSHITALQRLLHVRKWSRRASE